MKVDRSLVTEILDLRDHPRPRAWISRNLGVPIADVNAVLRVAGENTRSIEMKLSKYDCLESLVAEGCSFEEIRRTLGTDYRQVKRWFPGYRGVERGSEAHRELTKMGKKMRALEERQW